MSLLGLWGKWCFRSTNNNNHPLRWCNSINKSLCELHLCKISWDDGFPGGASGKESTCKAGDSGLIPGSGRVPGEGYGSPLQYSCLENPLDRGAWWAAVHGATKSQTRLSKTLFGWDDQVMDKITAPLYWHKYHRNLISQNVCSASLTIYILLLYTQWKNCQWSTVPHREKMLWC